MANSAPGLDPERRFTTIRRRPDLYLEALLQPRSSLALLAAFLIAGALIFALVQLFGVVESATRRDTLSVIIRGSWAVVGYAAAMGVASAGVIQVAKQVFGVRGFFQRIWVMQWIGSRGAIEVLWGKWRAQRIAEPASKTPPSPSPQAEDGAEAVPREAEDEAGAVPQPLPGAADTTAAALAGVQRELAATELESALIGGLSARELQRVFDLPVEQLCAQVGAVADLAMSQPQDYAELLLALSGPARLKEIDSLAPPTSVENGRVIRRKNASAEEYPLVAQAVRAGVDMMQISLGQRWQRGVRRSAVVISGFLGVIAAVILHGPFVSRILLVVAALVLGGFFAWLTRDLVAIVERVRR